MRVAGDGFTGSGAAQVVPNGAPFKRAEISRTNVAKIVAERILAIGCAGAVAENVRVAVSSTPSFSR